ncbi:aaa family ATPase [Grosmannia clavigera kw1407]|uniref:Aaa family ATPase n=1 Tax=Grosmannia clavigera (strain kw1407 / UAMH 11150) TaxID=655863 RepID=F0XJK3_GROCL|nr:aaa family ATPase [Grosmannia clavigera kw1407]EFX02041.1 aaa family ATPase [Grosmannia clavigera kw1407]
MPTVAPDSSTAAITAPQSDANIGASDQMTTLTVPETNLEDCENVAALQAGNAKQIQLESEVHDLKATILALVKKQEELAAREAEFREPFILSDEHRLALQHRRYNPDSDDSDDDDYVQFDHRRRHMERVYMRELKTLKREKEMIKNIRELRRDRDTLLGKEQAWEKERLDMMNRQKHQSRESNQPDENTQDDNAQASERSAHIETNDETGIAEAILPDPTETAEPKLNYVEWSRFSVLRSIPERSSFAIDVLVGEPIIQFAWTGYYGSNNSKRGRAKEDGTAASKSVKEKLPGQGPLPERIRIHSTPILKILETISGKSLTLDDDTVVMVRPFKFLVYYKDQIRHKFQSLTEKFAGEVGIVGDGVAFTPLPETPSGTRSNSLDKNAEQPSTALPEVSFDEAAKDDDDEDESTTSITALRALGCLVEFIDSEIQPKLDYLESDNCTRVSFTDIWYLFKPGDEVVDQGRKQAYRVIEVASVSHKAISPWRNYDKEAAKSDQIPVRLHCVHVDFDGKNIGPVSEVFEIPRFDGEMAITSLDVYPLRYLKESGVFREQLISRGKMFLDVAGIRHMHYNGLTLVAREEVDSQVVIDFEEAFASKDYSKLRPNIEELIGNSQLEGEGDESCQFECCQDENIHKDKDTDMKHSQDYVASLIPEGRNKLPSLALYPRALTDETALTEDELVIISYRVFGFVLRSRKWATLDLTHLSPVNSGEGHKKMVLSLVAQHFRNKESSTADTEQVDIVRGKGKGLILLLHGAPGVGKTTTAGDLGATANEVELALETNFALANRWGCILLLDEADVFLTARAPQDFTRNGLVAVFLRVLEYYAGVLFLTTNRIGDFDEAFVSRVHISLFYPQLDLKSTQDIFKLNLKLIEKRFRQNERIIRIDHDSILQYSENYWKEYEKMRWNGRQIRNGCQTALALAEFDAQGGSYERIKDANAEVKLQVEHLKTVSLAYLDFSTYLKDIYGKDADRRAKAIGIRARYADTHSMQPELSTAARPSNTPSSTVNQTYTPGSGVHPAHSSISTAQIPSQFYYAQQVAAMQQASQQPPNAYAQLPGQTFWNNQNIGATPLQDGQQPVSVQSQYSAYLHPQPQLHGMQGSQSPIPGQGQFASYPTGMPATGYLPPHASQASQQQQVPGGVMPPPGNQG